jgi:hypothetical protein
VVQDRVTDSLLRMDGKVVNRKRTISIAGETVALKAVEISISVDH